MTTTTSQTREHMQRELIKRLDQHPVESWSPHLLGFVLNALELEASGELEGLLRVPTGSRPTMTIQLDTTGLDVLGMNGTEAP